MWSLGTDTSTVINIMIKRWARRLKSLWKKASGRAPILDAVVILFIFLPLLNLILVKFRDSLNLTTNTLLLLIVTIAVATISPIWLTTMCAIENFLFLNYFFTPPFHTLLMSNRDDLIALSVYLTSSISASLILRTLKIRTAKLRQLSNEGRFLSNLANDIIRGNNSVDSILANSKVTFGLRDLAVVREVEAEGLLQPEIIHGSLSEITDEISRSKIELNSEYALLSNPPVTNPELRNLITTFGSQILILLERQVFEESEKALSDIRQTDQMRVALLNAVSHDLRGPLASSKAAISSLLNGDVTWSAEDQREFLESADHSLDQLNHLIENLLDMSRLESDSIFLNWGNVDVEDAISSGIKSLKSAENRVLLEIESDLPPIVGDPILLERVIGNLLENAIRFNPKESPVKVSAKRVDERIELRIIDHGPGISLKDKSRVFTPFQRLGDRDNTSGVGLGLAIVKGFTELMHGQIYLRETVEGGLTVILSFPAGETPHSASESELE